VDKGARGARAVVDVGGECPGEMSGGNVRIPLWVGWLQAYAYGGKQFGHVLQIPNTVQAAFRIFRISFVCVSFFIDRLVLGGHKLTFCVIWNL